MLNIPDWSHSRFLNAPSRQLLDHQGNRAATETGLILVGERENIRGRGEITELGHKCRLRCSNTRMAGGTQERPSSCSGQEQADNDDYAKYNMPLTANYFVYASRIFQRVAYEITGGSFLNLSCSALYVKSSLGR